MIRFADIGGRYINPSKVISVQDKARGDGCIVEFGGAGDIIERGNPYRLRRQTIELYASVSNVIKDFQLNSSINFIKLKAARGRDDSNSRRIYINPNRVTSLHARGRGTRNEMVVDVQFENGSSVLVSDDLDRLLLLLQVASSPDR